MELSRLTVDTVPQLWQERARYFALPAAKLGALKAVDSAGVAFLVRWAKNLKGERLILHQAPAQLVALLEIYRVKGLFKFAEDAGGL